jgi:hypothetical protein
MFHSKSLRVIGQSLELVKITAFELEADGPTYVVKCDSLTQTGEWVLRHALNRNDFSEKTARQSPVTRSVRFSPADISRLDDQVQLQRRRSPSQPEAYGRMSQLLRTLGDQLDQSNVSAFDLSWVSDSVSVYFQFPDGQCDSRTFTFEKLRQLASSSRFRRSSQERLDFGFRDFPKPTRPGNR